MSNPVVIDFPLKGIWISPNSPGIKVPSHGLDKYGETYAYDFVKVSETNSTNKFYTISVLQYLLFGVELSKCYGWGAEIYAPCDCEIIKVQEGVVERNKVKIINDLKYMKNASARFLKGNAEYWEIAGNYVVCKITNNVYALFAHMKNGSICVSEGDKIKRGQILGRVGHSGNSTAPHLHFQVMDSADIINSNGIPCVFDEYDEYVNGKWQKVKNGIPAKNRIRSSR